MCIRDRPRGRPAGAVLWGARAGHTELGSSSGGRPSENMSPLHRAVFNTWDFYLTAKTDRFLVGSKED
eukprot:6840284-Pyramimonas_sp.AAC.1